MVCKNRGICVFFGPSWVLIIMVTRDSISCIGFLFWFPSFSFLLSRNVKPFRTAVLPFWGQVNSNFK